MRTSWKKAVAARKMDTIVHPIDNRFREANTSRFRHIDKFDSLDRKLYRHPLTSYGRQLTKEEIAKLDYSPPKKV
jgi:hypothetical protein